VVAPAAAAAAACGLTIGIAPRAVTMARLVHCVMTFSSFPVAS
jgi:hypothetical protein